MSRQLSVEEPHRDERAVSVVAASDHVRPVVVEVVLRRSMDWPPTRWAGLPQVGSAGQAEGAEGATERSGVEVGSRLGRPVPVRSVHGHAYTTPHRASRPSVRLGRHPAPEHQRVNAVFRTQPWRDFTSLEDHKIKWHTRLAFGVGELVVTGCSGGRSARRGRPPSMARPSRARGVAS